MFLCINLSTPLGEKWNQKTEAVCRCASLTCVWVSASHRYTGLQQLAGLHGLPTQKNIFHIYVFTLKTMWKWAVARLCHPVPQVAGCELVICGWGLVQHCLCKKKKNQPTNLWGFSPCRDTWGRCRLSSWRSRHRTSGTASRFWRSPSLWSDQATLWFSCVSKVRPSDNVQKKSEEWNHHHMHTRSVRRLKHFKCPMKAHSYAICQGQSPQCGATPTLLLWVWTSCLRGQMWLNL